MFLLEINAASDWELFFGHFHPVVVHLPIGILIIAFTLEMVRIRAKNDSLNKAVSISLCLGFISALISCLFGWLLSSSGGYNESTLFWHQWLGISVAVVAGITWLLKNNVAFIQGAIMSKVYVGLFLLLMFLLTFTGHLGGNMTHGEDYLTMNTPEPFRSWFEIASKSSKSANKKITDINEAVVYQDLIAPVIEAKCSSCHNASKTKGGLRMDTEVLLIKGGKHGAVIVPKDAEGSELIKRVLLPESDEKRMPPKGKPALTNEEIALIKWWIANGASMKAKVKELPKKEEVAAYFKTMGGNATLSTSAAPNGDSSSKETPASVVFQQKVSEAASADIDALKKEHLIVSPVSQNQPFLEVSAVNDANLDDSKMMLISKIPQQLVWLKLFNTKITDGGLKQIVNCKNIVKLNIEGTAITGSSAATIKQFQNLEYLNVVNTKFDDRGLLELATLKNLKVVYCWQSQVSPKGIEAVKKLNPKLIVTSDN
ncbi:c-type cytochrome domain-containing protein [Parasediminibacterium sp. JCM 36343]|uniref:c-type cytochrome domain-containing protein n=1 Tax=Parasediminibacterium sp. JCM 36343 TaxID=3374279 RepID=UPI00397E0499